MAKQEKVITMITIGSTDGVTKDKWNRYTFRSGMGNSQEANSLALYTAKKHPKLTKFYNIGPDYEYGRTMWELFQAKTKELNPKAEFIGEQWPKLATPDYTSYINAILQAKPDAVFCSLWGGDLVAFFKQAKPYGLFDKMKWVIASRRARTWRWRGRWGRRCPPGSSPTSGTTSTGRTARGTRSS